MIAEVIVDVKSKNVNRPFSYEIPLVFLDVIECGMRVKVPFGNREVLGFVVNIKSEMNTQLTLKPISNILDITPSLTKELLSLAKKVSYETASFLIKSIQLMLPTAIKAKYVKKIKKLTEQINPKLNKYFYNKNEVHFDKINKEDLFLVKKAILENELELIYDVKNKLNIKYDTKVSLADDFSVKIKNLKNAKKQKAIVEYLLKLNRPITKVELVHNLNVANSTYNALLNKGIIIEKKREVYREPYCEVDQNNDKFHQLNEEQQKAYLKIMNSINNTDEAIFLLHGITGSGKTEVYLHVIKAVIDLDKEAILLVPEISLTPQIVKIFKERFLDKVAVLHSGLSIGEKYDEWRKIQKGLVKVAVGARSAIFAPFKNLGVIIIDEEHESSYKQDEMPKYHAREVAKFRAQYNQATIVLGSATPSLESYARAFRNVYNLLEIKKRATNTNLPKTEIINMTDEFKNGNLSIISDKLKYAIIDRVSKNEQIILLLNRRGYDNFLMCRSCGYTIMCDNCDISLTYHKSINRLKCHYCGNEQKVISKCPKCGSNHIKGFGYGTQKVEEELMKLFPNINIIRMDVDTTSNKGDHEKLLKAFRMKKAEILLGTQMIAKGLDFHDVTLVGVLSADTILKLPDFRSAEKTFQLVTQVSGRAGRHKENSEVIIQTYNPEHYGIILAANNNYKAFFNREMQLRKLGKYPPYYFLSQIVVSDEIFQQTMKEANKIANYLKRHLSKEVVVLGPVIPQIKRINNIYQTQIIIKYRKEPNLKKVLNDILISYNDKKIHLAIDMYPNFLL